MFARMFVLVASGLLGLMSMPANAATLTGDTAGVVINGAAFTTDIIGPGSDFVTGNLAFDFDFGGGDELTIGLPFAYTGCGLFVCSGTSTLELTGLDFSNGATLSGFLVTSTVLAISSISTTSNSVLITFAETSLSGVAEMLRGQFITTSFAVPIPTTLPLLVSGLGALGFNRLRRKRKAAIASA